MPTVYIETISEFRERHPGECVSEQVSNGRGGMRFTGRRIFPDLAVWFRSEMGEEFREPPTEELEILALRAAYHIALTHKYMSLESQCREYISLQSQYLRMGAGGGPHPAAFDELAEFIRLRDEAKGRAEETLVALEAHPANEAAIARRLYNERREQSRASANEAIAKMQSITSRDYAAKPIELERSEPAPVDPIVAIEREHRKVVRQIAEIVTGS